MMVNKLLTIIPLLILIVLCALIFFKDISNVSKYSSPPPEQNIHSPTTVPSTLPSTSITPSPPESTSTTTQTTISESSEKISPLSDMQIAACKAADSGSTCNTKLKEIGLVSAEDCCKYLKKCC